MKWIKTIKGSFDLLSAADDKLCIFQNDTTKLILKGHDESVTAVDGIWINDNLTIVTTSADSTVKLWRVNSNSKETVESFQTIELAKGGICFAVRLIQLSDAGLLLAFSTDDDKIHFYGENSNNLFEKVELLSGHEDWVRGLDFIEDDNKDVLLASSSQDSFIRLWRISPRNNDEPPPSSDELIRIDERTFSLGGKKFALSLESVLQGHENWVYSVHWNQHPVTKALQLLSSSMDKSMLIYTYDREAEMWTEKVRVGEVGGNTLGFYGGKFHPNGKSIIGVGFQGSLHLWHSSDENDRIWTPGIIQSGHFKEVKDIAWEPRGDFLISTSTDQTTRVHSCWDNSTYHEIARPQVHGYDMQCLTVLSRYKFASAAEEKIVRIFKAPANFVENFRNLVTQTATDEIDSEGNEIVKSNQKGASVPSLGLSNKVVYDEDLTSESNVAVEGKRFKDEYPENYFIPITMASPPTEEYLIQNTLWPEMQKLYAHGYEIFSLAASRDGSLLASACKATTLEHAEIILWNTSTWKIQQRLRSHKLTITQMKFSSDGKRLLAVSRDRRWSLFEKDSDSVNFQLISTTDKNNGIHERLIWCCDWSHDDNFFATGSRDGKVAVWCKGDKIAEEESTLRQYSCSTVISLPSESITALSFAHQIWNGNYLLAIGFESGIIQFYSFNGKECELLKALDKSEAHNLCVNRLQFRPHPKEFHLASCGNDNLVKIFNIH